MKRKPTKAKTKSKTADDEVDAFLRDLDHPLKKDIEAVRRILLGASPEIREGIKWNAPSFATKDYFATFFLRATDAVQLVFHRGAKAKDNSKEMKVQDPEGMIRWLAKDRCLVTIGSGKDIPANRAAFERLVRAWIRGL